MSKSRLEKFLYALYSLDSSDLPNPLSRIEELYKCLVTGDEAPTFEPISRVEKYLMAILGGYDVNSLPNPLSRVEVLLYKLATGDDNLDDIKSFLSEHEELLAEIIRNGGVGGNIDIEYVLYTLSTEHNTLYNTAKKPIKNAILKGQTLVNKLKSGFGTNPIGISTATKAKYTLLTKLEKGKDYTISFDLDDVKGSDTLNVGFGWGWAEPITPSNGRHTIKFPKERVTTEPTFVAFYFHYSTTSANVKNVVVVEGSFDDIPYFEGMASVKMPVLKTTGKNLFDGELISGYYEDGSLSKIIGSTSNLYKTIRLNLKKGTYTFSFEESVKFIRQLKDGVYDNIGGDYTKFTTTLQTDGTYILSFRKTDNSDFDLTKIQIEQGSTATSYEPYKSNILTTNEEVELRGIGDVKDELNVLRGEIIERTSQGILNGTETWVRVSNSDRFYTRVNTLKKSETYNNLIIADKIHVEVGHNYDSFINSPTNAMTGFTGTTSYPNENWIYLKIIGIENVESLKAYLQQNPINYSYVLGEEIIKTVDLSVVDQDGNNTKLGTFNDITHVTLSSEGLIPEAELEVATKNEEDLEDSIVYTAHTLSENYSTLYNTAEKPIKSAILKGNTLVNLVNDVTSNEVGNYSNSPCKINVIRNLQNETLTIIFNVTSLEIPDGADGILRIGGGWSGQIRHNPTLGVNKVLYNYNQTSNSWLGVFSNSGAYDLGQRITISDVMVLEGDYTNIDIPYFEGMQSVKMPVLTTTGKNLWNPKKMFVYENLSDELYSKQTLDFLQIGKKYVIKAIKTDKYQDRKVWIKYNGKDVSGYNVISEGQPTNHLPNGFIYTGVETLGIYSEGISKEDMCSILHDEYNFFIYESGTHSDVYEPYKSNILTVNEDVTLRGIVDVQDELDLLTGELTQRIGEVVLDGSEDWIVSQIATETRGSIYKLFLNDIDTTISNGNINCLSNEKVDIWGNLLTTNTNKTFAVLQNQELRVQFNGTLEELKNWLSTTKPTIQYIKSKSIKTVDLSVVDQDGNNTKLKTFDDITHVTLSSEGLIPEAELEVAEKVPEVATSMLTISREQEIIDTTTNTQSENVDATMIATTEIYEELL